MASTTPGGSAEADTSFPNAPLATTDNDDVNNVAPATNKPTPASTSGTLKRQQQQQQPSSASPVSSPSLQDSSKLLKNQPLGFSTATTSPSTIDPSVGIALGECISCLVHFRCLSSKLCIFSVFYCFRFKKR